MIDPTSRCVFPGIPRMNSSPYPMEILQLPDRVVFLYEYMHNFRVIWTDGREHRPTWPTTLMGDSIGWWEGDTLVIDTVNLSGKTWLDFHGNRHSDELHVIERWRRMSAHELWYEATIDDPTLYTEPWTTRLGHAPGAAGLGHHGVRVHRQQQGLGGGPPAAGGAGWIGAGRHRNCDATDVSGWKHRSRSMNDE